MHSYAKVHATLTFQKLKIYNFKCQGCIAFLGVNFVLKTISKLLQLYYCLWIILRNPKCVKVNDLPWIKIYDSQELYLEHCVCYLFLTHEVTQ